MHLVREELLELGPGDWLHHPQRGFLLGVLEEAKRLERLQGEVAGVRELFFGLSARASLEELDGRSHTDQRNPSWSPGR